jgi:hypothetical protein
MSIANLVINYHEQRFLNLHAMAWSQDVPQAYENFATDCRIAALYLASTGSFKEAFALVKMLDSIWVQNETPTLRSDFYITIAKALLVYEHQSDALCAFQENNFPLKPLEKIMKYLPAYDALRLRAVMEKWRQPLKG